MHKSHLAGAVGITAGLSVGVSLLLSQYAWEGPPNTNPWFVMDFGKPGLDAAAGWADEHVEAEVGPPGGGGVLVKALMTPAAADSTVQPRR